MAGHSKYANIKHRKEAQDGKKAQIFTKAVKEIIIAAKSGLPDPKLNNRLRTAILEARKINLPNDRIDAAIKKASSNEIDSNYDEIVYEGYGTCGIAFIIEAQTNNRNRTAGEIRSIFTKYGGNLGENGSVNYLFKHAGEIIYNIKKNNFDKDLIMNAAIEYQSEDCIFDKDTCHIITTVHDFHKIKDSLEERFGEPESSTLTWLPLNPKILDLEETHKVLKFFSILEDNEDVKNIYGNCTLQDIPQD
ncbi:YebC/PmpR family DNA-binding transcriptional regulator [Lyticum sinuosum]|uniref:Probable transcriptional regulatory protein Lyticum_00276 n=1 Tax=Lyticum sinuosum TaxID=1332059 RepID=A0AAE4VLP8_9RICK|nr:YebC/PmpR family DNA-binding transcriptional regulator [Lyticum sinuosum]MDZ5761111.1 YebC/PmpR family DNA-binding transcriptional regulator [Lyticum sinuosum]